METAEMRRSTLQRKDREELTEIASTLGKKPPTRARKGEIIDLILELVGGRRLRPGRAQRCGNRVHRTVRWGLCCCR